MTVHRIPARIMANVLTVSNLLLVIVVKDLEGMTAVLKVNLLVDTLSNDQLLKQFDKSSKNYNHFFF